MVYWWGKNMSLRSARSASDRIGQCGELRGLELRIAALNRIASRPDLLWKSGLRWLPVASVAAACVACGSGETGAPSPIPNGLASPNGFGIVSQSFGLSANEVTLSWSGTARVYRVEIGTTPQGQDIKREELQGQSYTLSIAPSSATYYARVLAVDGDRVSAPTGEVKISTVDLRHVIDALFFRAGPLSEGRAIQLGSTRAAVWPAGSQLKLWVFRSAGQAVAARVHAAAEAYSVAVDRMVTATTDLLEQDLADLRGPDQLPPFTIAVRVSPESCPAVASGCANYGPAPLGPNASIVNLRDATVINTVGHELGHAYGLGHILKTDSNRPELQFMMSQPARSPTLSEVERAAIAAAFRGGLHPGITRDEALARGLVLPYFGPSSRFYNGRERVEPGSGEGSYRLERTDLS